MPDDLTPGVAAYPALVQVRAIDDTLLSRIRERVPDPSVLEEFPPYTWTAHISNNNLDAYFTRMKQSSLRNYAADAETGVAFQDSHKTDGMVRTLGHSLGARFVNSNGNGVAHTDADFYTLTGMDPVIDSFVRRVRGGLARDVSIGFHGGEYLCSICGRDMMRDWDCWHIPGFEYVVTDEKGNKTDKRVLATADIENAHLSEVSTVYHGATPGAAIIKAQREAEAGRLKPEQARLLEARYRIHLPGTAQTYRGIDLPKEPPMFPKNENDDHQDDPGQRAITTLSSLRALFGADATDDGIVARVRELQTENSRLAPLAKDGETYRTDLVTVALAEGARAFGATFDPDTYRAILETAPLATVKRMRDDWTAVGDARFPAGRQTLDTDERESAPLTHSTPDAAFAA